MQDYSGIVHEPLLIFFSLSSVNDEHNVRNGDTRLSDVSRQDNLKETQCSRDLWDMNVFVQLLSQTILFSGNVKILFCF